MACASLSHIRPRDDPIMAYSARVSAGAVDPADRLRRARSTVIAGLNDPAIGAPQPVRSPTPIRTLPSAVASVVAARADAGLSPVGEFYPRRQTLRRVAVPAFVLAGIAFVLAVVALLRGQVTAGVITLTAGALLGALCGAALRHAHDDPLRIGPRERRIIAAASRWQPGRDRVESDPARALLTTAAAAAQRIVDSAAWQSGLLARGGVVVPLASELDLTEQRAARSRDEDWARLVTRVSALVAYADTVVLLDSGEPAAAEIEVLAFLLSAAIHNVG